MIGVNGYGRITLGKDDVIMGIVRWVMLEDDRFSGGDEEDWSLRMRWSIGKDLIRRMGSLKEEEELINGEEWKN